MKELFELDFEILVKDNDRFIVGYMHGLHLGMGECFSLVNEMIFRPKHCVAHGDYIYTQSFR